MLSLSNNHSMSLLSTLHQGKYPLHVDDKLEDLLFPFIPQKQCCVIIYDAIFHADWQIIHLDKLLLCIRLI